MNTTISMDKMSKSHFLNLKKLRQYVITLLHQLFLNLFAILGRLVLPCPLLFGLALLGQVLLDLLCHLLDDLRRDGQHVHLILDNWIDGCVDKWIIWLVYR